MASVFQVAPKLEDIIWWCWWRSNDTICSDLFTSVLTDEGLCYTFNTLSSEQMFNSDTWVTCANGNSTPAYSGTSAHRGNYSGMNIPLHNQLNLQVSAPFSSSSSSFYCPSVANAPNVLQPYCLIVLPLDVPALTASLLLWGPNGQRCRCLWTFLFSNVPTFATSRLQEILAAKGGSTWSRNGRWNFAWKCPTST